MKQYIVWVALLGIQTAAKAQNTQGTLLYERKIDVYRHLQDEQMKAMLPQFQTAQYQLSYNDSISVYKAVPKVEAPDPFDNGKGPRMDIKFAGPGDDGILYQNFSSASSQEEAILDDKKYIITDSIQPPVWKLTDETQTVLNHVCKRATTHSKRGAPVVAWYALDMPVAAGPDHYCGLPGVILKMDVDSGGIVFTALQIGPTLNAKDLLPPNGSKRITRADFAKKMDEVLGPADAQGRRIINH